MYPNLQGVLPDRAVKAVRDLYALVEQAQAKLDAIQKAGYLTTQQAATQFAAQAQKKELQVSGSAPMNVTGLLGQLAQPQIPKVTAVSALPNVVNDPLSQDGTLISLNGTIYRFDGSAQPGAWLPLGAAAVLVEDTHANKVNYPAANYPLNSLFWETDRTVFYHCKTVAGVHAWVYLDGEYVNTLANKPLDLGANDDGFRFRVSDYRHTLKWTNPAWNAWDGEAWDVGKIESFLVDPEDTTGWSLCDGSTVACLLKNGTTANVTLPDLVSAANKAAYLKYGTPASATANAATAPTLTMDSYTPAGTVSQPTFTGNAMATHAHELPFAIDAAEAPPDIDVISQAVFGTGTTRATVYHANGTANAENLPVALTEAVSAGTPSGTVSQPTFTGTPATLTGTITATAEPRNLVLRPWFRR